MRLRFSAVSGEVSTFFGAYKTILQLAVPANRRIHIKEWYIGFKGTTAANIPILVELLRQTTAGTLGGDGAAVTPTAIGHALTVSTTAQRARTDSAAWTAEPTPGAIISNMPVHEQSRHYWAGDPYIIDSGERVAIRVYNPNGAGVLCAAGFDWEE